MITLSFSTTTVILPSNLMWMDKYNWSMITNNMRRTIGGRAVIQEASYASQSGRNITLAGDESWIKKSSLDIIHSWVNDLGSSNQFTLLLNDGDTYSVGFRFWEKAIEVEPVVMGGFFDDNSLFNVKFLRFFIL